MQLGSRRPVVYRSAGFPTTPILDDFNRADGGLGSNWTTGGIWQDGSGPLTISSQQVITTPTANGQSYWNDTLGPDAEVYVDVVTQGLEVVLYLRLTNISSTTTDGYCLVAGITNYHVYRVDNAAFTQLGDTILADPVTSGDSVGFSAIGNTLSVYKKTGGVWTFIDSRSDNTYQTAGKIALELDDTSMVVDNFGGGTI